MGIRFNKSIKIGNFLKLNVSRNGLSATVGKRGASVNIGKRGAYLNLSPSAVGITGTGLSYRQKIAGGLSQNKKKKTAKSTKKTVEKTKALKKNEVREEDILAREAEREETIREYEENLEARVNLHKYTSEVMDEKQFRNFVDGLENEAMHQIYENSILGDEDTIENLVSSFMNELKLPYDVRVNYELEDKILYVDLDLPEIEDFDRYYPDLNKDRISYKKKTNVQMREEYARTILSLSIFLSANYFNVSSYIDEIVISGFTTVRNNEGDLVDQYLYSIRYTRDLFEKTKPEKIDDPYAFILKFTNRINMTDTYSFRPVKPYEMESVIRSNEMVDEAIEGLKGLGYKPAQIAVIETRLAECRYETTSEYLKEGLRLLNEEKAH